MKKGRTPHPAFGPFLCLLLLAACQKADRPTAEENQQLDNAEAMLDAAPRTLNALEADDLNSATASGAGGDGAAPRTSER
jgi:hypothetical protein